MGELNHGKVSVFLCLSGFLCVCMCACCVVVCIIIIIIYIMLHNKLVLSLPSWHTNMYLHLQACQPANVKNLELIIFIVLIIFIWAIYAPPTNYHAYPCQLLVEKKSSTRQSTCFLAQIHAEKTLRRDIWFAVLLCFVVVFIKWLWISP